MFIIDIPTNDPFLNIDNKKRFVADMSTPDGEIENVNNIPDTIDVFSIKIILNDTVAH